MNEQAIIYQLSNGAAVMLRAKAGRTKIARRARQSRFTPRGISLALASAYNAASLSISQAITGLSITLAGLGHAQAQSQAANLPQGGVAVHGSASIQQSGKTLNVNTTNGAGNRSVINWQSFNIGAGHTTNINQPNAQSSSLNRVVTNVPSQIHGSLRSNGQVILVNQNGIAVGAGGVVDTAGFTASTLNISDADYKAGRLRFEGSALSGGVQVDGVIRSQNGDVMLFAPQVATNKDAVVKADNGNVIVGAGQSVEVTGRGLEGVRFVIQGADNKAINLGTLQGNAVGVFAGTLRHSGVIQAQTATMEGGRVVLKAVKDVEVSKDANSISPAGPRISADGALNAAGVPQAGGSIRVESSQGDVRIGAGSQISANAAQAVPFVPNQPSALMNAAGGAIEIIASQGKVTTEAGSQITATGYPGGTIRISGAQGASVASMLNASSPGRGPADQAGSLVLITAQDIGGRIEVLSAANVSLEPGAQLLVSGDAGGGTILVGGDYQGANAEIANAQNTNVSQGVLLEANARVKGDGGKAIVWAEEATHFSGTLHAKGGEHGGDGGIGETSGKGALYYRGRADLGARRGRVGTLLLDPTFILIAGNGTLASADGSDLDSFPNLLNDSGNGGGFGEVRNTNTASLFTINESEIEGTNANIVLQATNKIYTSGVFTGGDLALLSGRSLSLQVTAAGSVGEGIDLSAAHVKTSGGGSITLSTTSSTGNGGIKLGQVSTGGGTLAADAAGEIMLKALVNTGNGNVSLNGQAVTFANIVTNGAINAGSGAVTLAASGGNGIAMASNTSVSGSLIKLKADKISIENAASLAASDRIEISAVSGTLGIAVGGTQDDSLGVRLGITSAKLARLTAPTLVFGDLSLTNPITLAGDISRSVNDTLALETLGSISQASTLSLQVGSLRLQGASGVGLGGSNTINTLSGSATNGYFYFKGSDVFKVGAVDGLSGITAGGFGQSLYLNASGGTSAIILESNINTAGASVQLDAAFVKIDASSVTIDTGGTVGSSGDISFGTVALANGVPTITGGVIFAASPGKTLNLNTAATSTLSNGGNIYLAEVSDHGGDGRYLKHLNINASPGSGGHSGIVHLTGNVELSATGTLPSNAATLQVGGAPLRIHSSAVVIDTNAANETLTPGGSILLGAIQGTSSNAELTLRAKGGPNGSGGIIEMGAVSTFTGSQSGYLGGLTADATASSTGVHGEIRLNGDIQTNPIFGTGEINLDGHVIVQAPSVTLRSSAENNDYAGDISVAWFGSVSASALGYSLTLDSRPDSSAPVESGAISVGFVSNLAGGSFLRHLNITAAHPTAPGDINLHSNIYLDRGPAAGDSASLAIEGGHILLHNFVLIDTLQSTTGEGGGVTIRADSISGGMDIDFDFTILTNTPDTSRDGGRVTLNTSINDSAGFAPRNIVINTRSGNGFPEFVDLYGDIHAGDGGSIDIQGRIILYGSINLGDAAGANNVNITLAGELNNDDSLNAVTHGLSFNTKGIVNTYGLEIGDWRRIQQFSVIASEANLGVVNAVGFIDARVAGSLYVNGTLNSNRGGHVHLEAGNDTLASSPATLAINANILSTGRDSPYSDHGEAGGSISAYQKHPTGTLQIANNVRIESLGGNATEPAPNGGYGGNAAYAGGQGGDITLQSKGSLTVGTNVVISSIGGTGGAGSDGAEGGSGSSGGRGGSGGLGGLIWVTADGSLTIGADTTITSLGGMGGRGGDGATGRDGYDADPYYGYPSEDGDIGGQGGEGGQGGSGGAIEIRSGVDSSSAGSLTIAGGVRSQGGQGGRGGNGGQGGRGGAGAADAGEGYDFSPGNGGAGGRGGDAGEGGDAGMVQSLQLGITTMPRTFSIGSASISSLGGAAGTPGDGGLGGLAGDPNGSSSSAAAGMNGSAGATLAAAMGSHVILSSDGALELMNSSVEGRAVSVTASGGDLLMDSLSSITGGEGSDVTLRAANQIELARVVGDQILIVAPEIVSTPGFTGTHLSAEFVQFGEAGSQPRGGGPGNDGGSGGSPGVQANVGEPGVAIKVEAFRGIEPVVSVFGDSQIWIAGTGDLTVGGIVTHVDDINSGTINIAAEGVLTTTVRSFVGGLAGDAGIGNSGSGDVAISLSGVDGVFVASSTGVSNGYFSGILATGDGGVVISSSSGNVSIDDSVIASGFGGVSVQAEGADKRIEIFGSGLVEASSGVVMLRAPRIEFADGALVRSNKSGFPMPGVVISADSLAISDGDGGGGSIESYGSPVALMPFTDTHNIHIVSDDAGTPNTLELSISDLARISTNYLQIGNASIGPTGGAVVFKTAYDRDDGVPGRLIVFGSTLTQESGALIRVLNLDATTTRGATLLDADNDIDELSGRVAQGGNFKLATLYDLEVISGAHSPGITVEGTGGGISLQAGGGIYVYANIDAGAGADNSSVNLKALGGAVTIDYDATVSGKNTSGVSVAITAQDLALNGTVDARDGGVSINPTSSAIGLGLGEGTGAGFRLEGELSNFVNYSNFYAGRAIDGAAFKSITVNQTADFNEANVYLRAVGLVGQSLFEAISANVLHVEAATVNLASDTNSVNVFSANVLGQGEGVGSLSFRAASSFDIGSVGIAVAATSLNSGFVSLTSVSGSITNTSGQTIQAGPGGMQLTANGGLGTASNALRVRTSGQVNASVNTGDIRLKGVNGIDLGTIDSGWGLNAINISTMSGDMKVSGIVGSSGHDDAITLTSAGGIEIDGGHVHGNTVTLAANGGGISATDSSSAVIEATQAARLDSFDNIGSASNPLNIEAASFAFGAASGGTDQKQIWVKLAKTVSATLGLSDLSLDDANLETIGIAAGGATAEILIDRPAFSNNTLIAYLDAGSGAIRVTQADAVFNNVNSGSITFKAANTYIESSVTLMGKLSVDGNTTITNTGTLSSPSGTTTGTLDQISGSLTVAGGLQPGGAGTIGTLTINGNVVMASTGVFGGDLGTSATNGDRLIVNGSLTAGGTVRIKETNLSTTQANQAYTLATATATSG